MPQRYSADLEQWRLCKIELFGQYGYRAAPFPAPTTSPNYGLAWGTPSGATENGFLRWSNVNGNLYPLNPSQISDGLSNTIAVGEATVSLNDTPTATGDTSFPVWAGAHGGGQSTNALGAVVRLIDTNFVINNWKLGGKCARRIQCQLRQPAPRRRNFLMADGSSKFISQNIDMPTYKAAATASGSEQLPLP